MPDLSSNIAVLRRWAHARPDEPMPANFGQWATANGTDAMQLQRQDPELFALLTGRASASLVADALQGRLSPVPVSEEQRAAEARRAEMQDLYNQSKSEQGLSLTQTIRMQSAFPELADKIAKENPQPVYSEEDQALWAAQRQQEQQEVRRASVARSMAATRTRL